MCIALCKYVKSIEQEGMVVGSACGKACLKRGGCELGTANNAALLWQNPRGNYHLPGVWKGLFPNLSPVPPFHYAFSFPCVAWWGDHTSFFVPRSCISGKSFPAYPPRKFPRHWYSYNTERKLGQVWNRNG